MAELSNPGSARGAITSLASTRPTAASIATRSLPTRGTRSMTARAASATDSIAVLYAASARPALLHEQALSPWHVAVDGDSARILAASTSACSRSQGLVRSADGDTLFLDEIGERARHTMCTARR